jgi:hypothetical protein
LVFRDRTGTKVVRRKRACCFFHAGIHGGKD